MNQADRICNILEIFKTSGFFWELMDAKELLVSGAYFIQGQSQDCEATVETPLSLSPSWSFTSVILNCRIHFAGSKGKNWATETKHESGISRLSP